MKPQDIMVLLKVFLKKPGGWTIALLAHELFISKSEVHAGIKRLKTSGLMRDSLVWNCAVPNCEAMAEFLIHGLKYAFPAVEGKEMRGMPTSHSASPLNQLISGDDNDIYVWPYEFAHARGKSISPLYKSTPKAAEFDSKLYELLVLIDGIRIGRARESKISVEELLHQIKKGSRRFLNAC